MLLMKIKYYDKEYLLFNLSDLMMHKNKKLSYMSAQQNLDICGVVSI